jgi:hypothetical protein
MIYFLLIAWSMVLGWVSTADAATYWVAKTGSDSRSCAQAQSPSAAKRTIRSGLTCLGPGDTLSIKAGTYAESNLRPPSGISGKRVTIKAATAKTVIVSGTQGAEAVFWIDEGERYITVEGLIVDAAMKAQKGFLINGHHIRVKNTEVKYAKGQNLSVGSDTTADQFVELLNLHVHHAGGGAGSGECNSTPPEDGYCHGIYMSSNRNLVDGGSYHDNNGYSLHIYPTGGNNVIRNARWQGRTFGPAIGIFNGTGNQVYNNLVYGNSFEGIMAFGPGAVYANNTVYNNQGAGIFIRADAPAAVFRNNIVYHNRGGDIVDEAGKATLSNNLTSDPRFVNAAAGDLHLTSGSPAIDTGMTVSTVTTDFDQRPRPQGAGFDIGAYEYPDSALMPPSAPTNLRRVSP